MDLKKSCTCSVCENINSCFIKLESYLGTTTKTLDKQQLINCEFCDYSTKLKSTLGRHLLKAHYSKKARHECLKCTFSCESKSGLKAHMVSHSNNRPFPCHFCDYRAKLKGSLKNHILTVHTADALFKCELCDYCSKAKNLLFLHMRSKHNTGPQKLIVCPKCDFSTCYSGNLPAHMLTHTAERMFNCEYCDYRAKSKGRLKTHIRLFHVRTAEKAEVELMCELQGPP